MHAEVGAVHGGESLAEIAQGGLATAFARRFRHDDQHVSALGLAESVEAERVVTQAEYRLLAHLDLRHEVAQRRIGADEVDAARLAHHAAAAVAADQIFCAQRLAAG